MPFIGKTRHLVLAEDAKPWVFVENRRDKRKVISTHYYGTTHKIGAKQTEDNPLDDGKTTFEKYDLDVYEFGEI